MQSKQETALKDPFGREISYLRLSVTDRCDFRCVYCMDEKMTFVPREQVLSLEEMQTIAEVFVSLGVRKVRLTGGEPLIRTNVLGLCRELGAIDGLDELVMTTNGSRLATMAPELKAAGLKRLNISLDSLQAERFRRLTRTGKLEDVQAGIEAAIAAGFERIKLNTVILKGRNDDEIEALVDYAVGLGIDISFIEEMPLGSISEHDRAEAFMASDEIRERIAARWDMLPCSGKVTDGPSRMFKLTGTDSRVGFISPHSHNFCGECNRVRVTAEGRLLLCLGHEHSLDLKAIIRRYPGDRERLQKAIILALDLKPERHYFDHSNEPEIVRFMNATGG
ncbi:MAG: GTP 3',8-cyclase MoaA [Oleiphilus sp.]|nr:MAG: GTP 3',8-cyclase MoaA [Oleiphilus sp.]